MRTCFRFRPLLGDPNVQAKDGTTLEVDADSKLVAINKTNGQQLEFTADQIFDQTTKQSDVFDKVGRRFIDNCLEGYNTTVFAYGQTGAGKTYTMFGAINDMEKFAQILRKNPKSPQIGLTFRCIGYLFQSLSEDTELSSFNVSVSAVEIYQEKVYDTLNTNIYQRQIALKLQNKQVRNLTSISVASATDCADALFCAVQSRTTESTNMNNVSSRSHLVITISVEQNTKAGGVKESKIHFVDLAGSERVSKTGAADQRLEEAKSINSSLLALGRVVDALVKKSKSKSKSKNKHKGYVPYRDSVLTSILSDSLGGNSLTTMIGCAHSNLRHLDETASTLHFIARTRQIRNHAIVNQRFDANSYQQLKKSFDDYRAQVGSIIDQTKQKYEQTIEKLEQENRELKSKLAQLFETKQQQETNQSLNQTEKKENSKKIKHLEQSLMTLVQSHQNNMAKKESEIDNLRKQIEQAESKLQSLEEQGSNAYYESMVGHKGGSSSGSPSVERDNNPSDSVFDYKRGQIVDISKLGKKFRRVMFLEAVQRNDISQILKMLKFININSTDSNGEGALAFSIKANNIDMLHVLLKNKANANIVDLDTISPLMVATVYQRYDAVKLLLKYGSNVDFQNSVCLYVMYMFFSHSLFYEFYVGDTFLKLV